MELKNKVAIITGGASGLGEATIRRFHAKGAKVVIFDMNEERANTIIKELGDGASFQSVDVSNADSVQTAISNVVESHGALHIACNFAGISWGNKIFGRKGPHPYDDFQKIVDVNLFGTFNVCRFASEVMSKHEPVTDDGQRGIIINTSSIAAYEGQVGQVAYSASKGAIVGMTLPMARDLAPLGIRVNTIVPGLIHTPLFDTIPEDYYKSLVAMVPNPARLGHPDEIARTAQYFVECDYVNAECIRMDGAVRMQPR